MYFTVDQETYLHQEKDPRYRGPAIPSRAFRFLQNMTESNDTSVCAGKIFYIQDIFIQKFLKILLIFNAEFYQEHIHCNLLFPKSIKSKQ